ncbi:polyprenyl synthetase family protein [Polaromonas sp. CG_9.11]|uniref:polyprenyl synthetase family protein n=1 Tax=Polaromonas sp. CG_9.11 TaxID=2787730 RepID=UPI0018CA6B9B|nr:polyprenyl synthetase family protein [Polaromonas sp. CG_9.11]MBG6075871.1 geranylgeranyl pyrophosphate synthase [Polaromonas sp. CG_9.11]
MQTCIAVHPALVPDPLLPLLHAVQEKMIGSIRPKADNFSKEKMGGANAAAYHLSAGGQRVRAKMALHAGLAVGLSTTNVITIAATAELLHNASLIHDDIQDRDEVRRGKEAVWVRFGVNTAICAGDLLLSAAHATICQLDDSGAVANLILLMHERVATAIEGQSADLAAGTSSFSDDATALRRYEQIAMAKSGALLSLPLELVLLAAGHQNYLPQVLCAAEAFAVGYQIVDDLHDLQSDLSPRTAKNTYNIISVLEATGSLDDSIEKARTLGLEKIDLAIALAKRLPYNTGELLGDYAHQLRTVLLGHKFEALIGGH